MPHYARPALAQQFAISLEGKTGWGDTHNGLFLAAPRRTGKSSFLQNDLQPELEQRGVVVVYVDLWSDTTRDPAALIAGAIGRELQKHLGFVARTATKAGLKELNIAGTLKVDTSKIGTIDGLTLPDALRMLHETARAPVALIIDEAQHALTRTSGEEAMKALKSARDQLNKPDQVNLMLIMSGSDRDKLLRLVNTNSAPFYGSVISHMPTLGAGYIKHVVQTIERERPDLKPVNAAVIADAFMHFGERPQFFSTGLAAVCSPMSAIPGRFEDALLQIAVQRQRDEEVHMDSTYRGLKVIEQVVLWRLLEQEASFRPFDADALAFYKQKSGNDVTPPQVQRALDNLRKHSPVMVWKSAWGEYAVEDAAMHRWYKTRANAGQWPPA